MRSKCSPDTFHVFLDQIKQIDNFFFKIDMMCFVLFVIVVLDVNNQVYCCLVEDRLLDEVIMQQGHEDGDWCHLADCP
jgi:hypothetical protein